MLNIPKKTSLSKRKKQGGVILFVVLIMLAALMMAAASAIRSSDTSGVVAGNFQAQRGAIQASDRAISDAMNALSNIVVGGGGNTNVANRYTSIASAPINQTSLGIPNYIQWSLISCTTDAGGIPASCGVSDGNYIIQYYIERLCVANPTITDISSIRASCDFEPNSSAGSYLTISLRYRIIVHVIGPKGSETFYESVVSGAATTNDS